nr:GNAT family N-acetyltransferase [Schlegelella koreensis]
MHALSSYAPLSFDREKVAGVLARVIEGGVVYVATRNEQIVGGIAGGVTEHWFGHSLHGYDVSFFVDPAHRHGITAARLLGCFEQWCKARGAVEVRLGITTGLDVEATSRFYESQGYARSGALFTKEVHHGH